ncbi:MAG: thioredoxin family protein [Spirochaetaceae bacterium]|nr:thioredoxin family protein [Spirochaetaceae bacterium]
MKNLENTSEFQTLADGDMRFCALFSADWCPDCRVLKAVLPGLEEEFGDRFVFSVVDTKDFPELAEKYDILGIPSLIAFHRGEVIGTFISTLRKTRKQIVDFLKEAQLKI